MNKIVQKVPFHPHTIITTIIINRLINQKRRQKIGQNFLYPRRLTTAPPTHKDPSAGLSPAAVINPVTGTIGTTTVMTAIIITTTTVMTAIIITTTTTMTIITAAEQVAAKFAIFSRKLAIVVSATIALLPTYRQIINIIIIQEFINLHYFFCIVEDHFLKGEQAK